MKIRKERHFQNGAVYCLECDDGKLIEVTDTFLPFYTKDAIGRKQNKLDNYDLGDRTERWMIGISCMSGCPVRCKFCATGNMKSTYRNLTVEEMIEEVDFIRNLHPEIDTNSCKEFKVNMTRMGEPALNWENVHKTADILREKYPNVHVYISTIGIKGTDFSWIKDNVTLQISLHSFDERHRDWLIPFKNKMTIKELGEIRTQSNLKTTINLTLVEESDFDINELKKYFDPKYFFVKLSPINPNEVSDGNKLGKGFIEGINLV
jgi:23S rRNA (adenine2503-C2)-methyltransferase